MFQTSRRFKGETLVVVLIVIGLSVMTKSSAGFV